MGGFPSRRPGRTVKRQHWRRIHPIHRQNLRTAPPDHPQHPQRENLARPAHHRQARKSPQNPTMGNRTPKQKLPHSPKDHIDQPQTLQNESLNSLEDPQCLPRTTPRARSLWKQSRYRCVFVSARRQPWQVRLSQKLSHTASRITPGRWGPNAPRPRRAKLGQGFAEHAAVANGPFGLGRYSGVVGVFGVFAGSPNSVCCQQFHHPTLPRAFSNRLVIRCQEPFC